MQLATSLLPLLLLVGLGKVSTFRCGEKNQCQCSYQLVFCDRAKAMPRFPPKVRVGKDVKLIVDAEQGFDLKSLDESYGFENVIVHTNVEGMCETVKRHYWWVHCLMDAVPTTQQAKMAGNGPTLSDHVIPVEGRTTAFDSNDSYMYEDEYAFDSVDDDLTVHDGVHTPTDSSRTQGHRTTGAGQRENAEPGAEPATGFDWRDKDFIYGSVAAVLGLLVIMVLFSFVIVARKDSGKQDPACIVCAAEACCCITLIPCRIVKLIGGLFSKCCCCSKKAKASDIQMQAFDNPLANNDDNSCEVNVEYERAYYKRK